MAVREHKIDIPFGVVEVNGTELLTITEKPVKKLFVNAAMYVLNPELLADIPKNTCFDMPALFQAAAARGDKLAAFPVHEYWIDIGEHEQLERARQDYAQHFPPPRKLAEAS